MWRRSDGFTFLELAVVVVIMSIMMVITLPRFTSTFSRASLGGTARRLAGTMAYLRNAAAKQGRSFFLNIDLDNNEYWATVINEEAELSQTGYQDVEADAEGYTEFTDSFIARTRLENKIAFTEVVFENETRFYEGTARIEFRPDGTSDETVVYLTDPKERVYTVYLEHYNGQATAYKNVFVPEPAPVLTEREPAASRREAL